MNNKKRIPFNCWKRKPVLSSKPQKKGSKISGTKRKKIKSISEIDEIVKNVKREEDDPNFIIHKEMDV